MTKIYVCGFCMEKTSNVMKVAENESNVWSLIICLKCWGQTIRWSAAMARSMLFETPIPISCVDCKRPYFKANMFEIIEKDLHSFACDACMIERQKASPRKTRKNILL